MERCKHCGEVVDRTDFIYCPACGKLLSDDSVDKKALKKQEKQAENKEVAKQEKRVDVQGAVKQENRAGVVACKTNDKEGGRMRRSYIVFGVLALLIGITLVLTSGYWGASSNLFGTKFAEKMADLSDKIIGKTITDSSTSLKLAPATVRGLLFYFLCVILISIISVITFFSLFTKRTTAGHVLIKIGSLILMDFLMLFFFVCVCPYVLSAGLQNAELLKADKLQSITDFLDKSTKMLENFSLYCMIGGGAFVLLGIVLSITKFGNPYNTTFYQYFRAFFLLACCVLYYVVIAKNSDNKFLTKLTNFLLNGFPYYLVVTSLCMFFSAKMKKS